MAKEANAALSKRLKNSIKTIESLPDPDSACERGGVGSGAHGFSWRSSRSLDGDRGFTGRAGYSIFDKFGGDELVSNLLLLYGLHPLPLETRVFQALEKVKPQLASHGGDVELLEISEGVVRLRLHGSCNGCPSSAETLKLAIEAAIYAAAP